MDIESRVAGIQRELDYFRPIVLKARDYMMSDPEGSLNKARIAGEALCKRLYQLTKGTNRGGKPVDKLEFGDLMHHLRGQLPPTIVGHLEYVQRLGNYGSHDHGLDAHPATPDDAITCLHALSTAIAWFFQEYFGQVIKLLDRDEPAAGRLPGGREEISRPGHPLGFLPPDDMKSQQEPTGGAQLPPRASGIRVHRAPKSRQDLPDTSRLPPRGSDFFRTLPLERRAVVSRVIALAQKQGLRVSFSARDTAIKIRNDARSDLLWKPTLAVITGDGNAEVVPKWLVPDLAVIFGNGSLAEDVLKRLIKRLQPLRVQHPQYPTAYYYAICGREEEFVSAVLEVEKSILEQLPSHDG